MAAARAIRRRLRRLLRLRHAPPGFTAIAMEDRFTAIPKGISLQTDPNYARCAQCRQSTPKTRSPNGQIVPPAAR
jgi:hypothetical protein